MHRDTAAGDYYEALQISRTADAEMVHAAYRTLVRRFHPDNQKTGNSASFRLISEAHQVLSDADRRAKYDSARQDAPDRWQVGAAGSTLDNDFEVEQIARLMVLDLLYTKRRVEPRKPSVLPAELSELTGRRPDQLEFTIWFLSSKGFLQRSDNAGLSITVAGAEYLEENHDDSLRRRLPEAAHSVS